MNLDLRPLFPGYEVLTMEQRQHWEDILQGILHCWAIDAQPHGHILYPSKADNLHLIMSALQREIFIQQRGEHNGQATQHTETNAAMSPNSSETESRTATT